MVEQNPDVVHIAKDEDDGGETLSRPVNTKQTQKSSEIIKKNFDDFNELLREDQKDALVTTIKALK